MGFLTIFMTDGLSERDYRKALRSGPSFVSTRRKEHREMILSAGFERVVEVDLTDEFLITNRGWHDGRERYRDEFVATEGLASFEERQQESRAQIAGIESGLLRRALFVCS
jgi:hypothetical protein